MTASVQGRKMTIHFCSSWYTSTIWTKLPLLKNKRVSFFVVFYTKGCISIYQIKAGTECISTVSAFAKILQYTDTDIEGANLK